MSKEKLVAVSCQNGTRCSGKVEDGRGREVRRVQMDLDGTAYRIEVRKVAIASCGSKLRLEPHTEMTRSV